MMQLRTRGPRSLLTDRIAEAKPEFRTLAEEAVLGALGDADPANRIAAELARLVEAYSAFFASDGDSNAYIRGGILRFSPRRPIEVVAMRLVIEAFQESVMQKAAGNRHAR